MVSTSPLMARVAQALAPEGALARAWPEWRAREAQAAMAQAGAQTVEEGGALLVEAPAGSGKTLAYLLPWLLSGRRAVISTSTHVLQRQLAERDLPRLASATGQAVRVAVLKGRGRYVCLARLQAAVDMGPRIGAPAEHAWLRELLLWAERGGDGDLDQVAGVDTIAGLHGRVTSTSENCARQACARWAECHVERARRAAQAADVVVINHHVWLAELQRQRRGRPRLLPEVDVVVFDEAHALHGLRARLDAEVIEHTALQRLWADLTALADGPLRGLQAWRLLAHDGQVATRGLAQALGAAVSREGRQAWPLGDRQAPWRLATAVAAAQAALRASADADPRLGRLLERTRAAAAVLHTLLSSDDPAAVWLDWQSREDWACLRPAVENDALAAHALVTGTSLGARSVVHASATLGQDEALLWHRDALAVGADWSPRTLRLRVGDEDPGAAALYVPEGLPEPAEATHPQALAERIVPWIELLGGRCLVLATTRRAAQRLAQALQARGRPGWRVLLVGDKPTHAALQALRHAGGGAPTIVVACGALWQGIDVPGEALQLLVIDKLPFAPPDDPWLQRRLERARAVGADPFTSVQLADAAMALRQGAGRLIRRAGDRGLIVIGDVRLRRRAYGPALLAALPACRWLDTEGEVQAWLGELEALTRSSTTDRPSAS
ncbi:ATP-dependent DNA helicase [Hydrogenophaga sp. PBC]|uniref:ATP-dependent DNA helicase n=1 Tax=Hydrogenophaga sp. PBC TaxID=795665 RepID=UPI001314D490|nr:ATP-dependent DNA helicase [Hydrogenophaga sp. PBC]